MKEESEYQTTLTNHLINYQFPALRGTFGYFTLDGEQELTNPFYYKYDDGTGSNLSAEEKIYNMWVKDIDNKVRTGRK